MAYNEQLASRVRKLFGSRKVAFEEKTMMGGLCFLVDGKMCLGVEKDRLSIRDDVGFFQAVRANLVKSDSDRQKSQTELDHGDSVDQIARGCE